MARTPFKLRSGNATPFKQMGSSPVKQEEKKTLLGGIGKVISSFGDFLSSKKKKSSTNIGDDLRKKYGTGEYKIGGSKGSEAGIRPGESKRKFKKRPPKKVVIDKDIDSGGNGGNGGNGGDGGGTTNFGITTGMSFKQAFKQAGVGGAKKGDIFDWKGKKFKYEFKK